ncbi:MAG TPA: hypothetical protein VJG32_04815 [Anaerolineae bacterium]|nr:hypothetical protein [Anaerolineae bacterium]
MKRARLWVGAVLLIGLMFGAWPAAAADSVSVGIYSIAACKDVSTVTVNGSSTYSNNRLDVSLYHKNDKGQDVLLKQVFSSAFGAGQFMLAVTVPYTNTAAAEGEALRVEVQAQRLSGNTYVDVGNQVVQNVTVADRNCFTKCSVTVDATDTAPAAGTLTLRTHFGEWFRPEGRLQGAMPVSAGKKARVVFVGVPCNWPVRVWYYPKTGDKTPKLLPAQYWPNEYQANQLNGTNPYTTSFAKGLKPTHPLESDDPFVVK